MIFDEKLAELEKAGLFSRIVLKLLIRYRQQKAALEKISNLEHLDKCNCSNHDGPCCRNCPEDIAKEALKEDGGMSVETAAKQCEPGEHCWHPKVSVEDLLETTQHCCFCGMTRNEHGPSK